MFEEYEVVRLIADIPEENLRKGDSGTVLLILTTANPVQHYIVEFLDDEGNSLGTPIVPENMLERAV